MATLPCPSCDTVLKIPPTFTGTKARCPKCRGLVTVPQEEVEVVEEDSSPSRPGAPKRKPRLRQEDEEEEPVSKRRRPARDDVDDEPEEDEPAPRKKKPRRRKRESQEGPGVAAVVGIGLFVFALWLLMAGLGYKFRGVSYAMLIVGAVLSWIGTKWILSIAAEEGTGTYLACLFVPFFDTWFTFTRIGRTWMPCLICWAGRFFAVGAIVLLILHFFHEARDEIAGGRGGRGGVLGALVAGGGDAMAEQLLREGKSAEARAWFGEANKRRNLMDWGRQKSLQMVNDLYARGAVKVMAVDIDPDEDLGEVASHLVVTLPAEPEKRRALLALMNERFRDDEPRVDKGQKYEVLTPD